MLLSLMYAILHWWKYLPVSVLLYLFLPSCTSCTNVEDLSFQHKRKLNSLPPHFPHLFPFFSRTEYSATLMSAFLLFKKKFKKEIKMETVESLLKDAPSGFLLTTLDGGNGLGLAARSLRLQRCSSGLQNGYFVHLSFENGKLEMQDLRWI